MKTNTGQLLTTEEAEAELKNCLRSSYIPSLSELISSLWACLFCSEAINQWAGGLIPGGFGGGGTEGGIKPGKENRLTQIEFISCFEMGSNVITLMKRFLQNAGNYIKKIPMKYFYSPLS